jgi:NADPH:quinone reductase-like Zn-dependent oxidoreductase
MKAIVYNKFGSAEVLELKTLATPVPKDDEVLIRVKAVSINKGDHILMNGDPFLARPMVGSFFKPRKNMILGSDVSGRIESVGKLVKDFNVGDDVVGDLSGCGFGGFAEFVCAKANILVLKPEHLSYEEAAAIPLASVTALKALRDVGQIRSGQRVLIHGASGGVGSYAVQIAKALGAEVTAVCSTRNIEMVKALGADYIIDYSKEDFTRNNKTYDLIHAVNGNISIFKYKKSLTPQGIYVMSGGAISQMFQAALLGPMLSRKSGRQFRTAANRPDQQALQFLMSLTRDGRLRPVIDSYFPLESSAEAFHYFKKGESKGKIIIQVNQEVHLTGVEPFNL